MSYDWEDEFENRYMEGFNDGYKKAMSDARRDLSSDFGRNARKSPPPKKKKPRKLSAWQKFVKTNSKMPRFKYKTGKRKGMVNMKALAAAWKRKKKR